jgi:arylsulfatase A-like enzyme
MKEKAIFDPNQRPNLLILITDQERAVMHFPDDWATKNLSSLTLLKNNGVEFTNGCCNSCMCSPSRSTFFSGLYPAQHGVTDTLTFGGRYSVTEAELDPGLSNLALMLRPHYDVHYRGKWHLSKGGMNSVDPEKSLMAAEVAQFGFRGWTPPDAGEDIALPNFGGGFADHDDNYIQQAIQFIRQWKLQKQQGKRPRPFALVLSLVNPHDVLSYPKTYTSGGYDDTWLEGELEPPASSEENLLTNWKPAAQWLLKGVLGISLGALNAPGMEKAYINFYGNLMRAIDLQIAELMEEFYERDEEGQFGAANSLGENTLMLRLADHGEMGLAHGGLRQKAFNVYDETLRVPYIFSNPKVINPSGKPLQTAELAGLIDIIPTLASLLGITPPENIKGTDLSKAVLHPEDETPIQESHLFTFDDIRAGNKNQPQSVNAANRIRCVRTRDWKYARYFHADGSYLEEYELYYIRGIENNELYPGNDPNDPLGMALKGQPYECVNLAYENNPDFQNLPAAAQAQAREAHLQMVELLKRREKDILTGHAIQIRKQLTSNRDAQSAAIN